MSQANYYLQKFRIIAKRFVGSDLMRLKILGLLKNDVKVCSYITFEEAQTLLQSFNNNPIITKTGEYYYTENIFLFVKDSLFNKYAELNKEPSKTNGINNNSNEPPMKLINCILVESVIYASVESLKNILQPQQRLKLISFIENNQIKYINLNEESSTETLQNNKRRGKVTNRFIAKQDAINFLMSISNVYKNMKNIDMLFVQCPTVYPCPVKIEHNPNAEKYEIDMGNMEIPKKININIYEINKKRVIAMPDINKIIRLSQGYSDQTLSGAHCALLRQINYYLGKLKSHKQKFTFSQLKQIRQHGTVIGNATYSSYVSISDAFQLFEVFSTLNINFSKILKNIQWSETITLDEGISTETSTNLLNKMSPIQEEVNLTSKDIDIQDEAFEIFYYSNENRNYINLHEFHTTLGKKKIDSDLFKNINPPTIHTFVLDKSKLLPQSYTLPLNNNANYYSQHLNDIYINKEEILEYAKNNPTTKFFELINRIHWVNCGSLIKTEAKNDDLKRKGSDDSESQYYSAQKMKKDNPTYRDLKESTTSSLVKSDCSVLIQSENYLNIPVAAEKTNKIGTLTSEIRNLQKYIVKLRKSLKKFQYEDKNLIN